MPNSNILIDIKGIGKTFGGAMPVKALDSFSLKIREGEFISIVGPSGCGKTTLLEIIAGLEKPTAGTIKFAGGANESGDERKIGLVFQDANLLPWRTAIGNTILALELNGYDSEECYAKAKKALELVGIAGFENSYPKDLSGGMKQRVAIARSLVHDPLVLLMDEPFSALDEITRTKMNFELLRIWKETRKTIIYVTHDVDEAALLSNRVVVLSARPATLKKVIDINLLPERDINTKDTEQFIRCRKEVREALHADENSTKKAIRNHSTTTASALTRLKHYFLPMLVFALFIGFWKLAIYLFNIPAFLVPVPENVFAAYISLLKSGILLKHTAVTLNETLLGFVLGSALGIGIGYPLAKSRKLEHILSPYIVAAQTAPKLAIAPLIVIWFGFGIASKVALVTLIVFFPVLINTLLGVRSVDKNQRDLFKSTNASRLQIFTKLELPSALPIIFAGLKTGITLAVVGAVVGEFAGAEAGLGYMTFYASGLLDTPAAFVAIIQLTMLGILLYAILSAIEAKLMPWNKHEEII